MESVGSAVVELVVVYSVIVNSEVTVVGSEVLVVVGFEAVSSEAVGMDQEADNVSFLSLLFESLLPLLII